MRKICAPLLAAVLLSAPAAQAKTVVVRTDWEKAQAMLAQDDFLSSIRVELQSGKRLKGKLIGTTDEALRIERKKAETAIVREDIRAVRLVPRKATRQANRAVAIAGGAAAGFGGGLAASAAYCLIDGSPCNAITDYAVFFGTWAAIQFAVYRLGPARRPRRRAARQAPSITQTTSRVTEARQPSHQVKKATESSKKAKETKAPRRPRTTRRTK